VGINNRGQIAAVGSMDGAEVGTVRHPGDETLEHQRGAAGLPVAGSQNRTALSQLPVATILPSCRKLALRTEP
jgi:hypothetical protein